VLLEEAVVEGRGDAAGASASGAAGSQCGGGGLARWQWPS
jgi:hypothetical protein